MWILSSDPSKPKKTGTFGTFFGRQPAKFWKSALAFFGRNFLHWRKFHKTQFKYIFQRYTGHLFTIEAVLRSQHIERSDAFWDFSACKVYKEVLGAFSPIFASQNKAVCHEVQMHFLSYPSPMFTKMFWAHFHDFCVQKRSCLPWSPGAFWRCSLCKLKKSSGRIFPIYASKNEAVYRGVQTHFESFRLLSFIKKVVAAFCRFMRPKTKLFAVKFRRIPEALCLQVLKKKLWAQFHDLCVQKRSCFPWNSDAFWKFSACKIYRKSSGRNSTICATKNEAICREIQTHSGRSLPARFTEKVVGAIPPFVRPKTKLFVVKNRRILDVFALQLL